jgi:hypothetical protein
MTDNSRPVAVVIDEVRADYAAGRIDRASALLHIQSLVSVTEQGAADLLDHQASAQECYAHTDCIERRGGDW